MSEEKLARYQDKNANDMVQYAIKHSKFFRTYFNNRDLKDIWNLPTTSKSLMMENLTDYNTMGFDKEEMINFCLEAERANDYSKRFHGCNLAMSSGTSGNKAIVLTHPYEEKYLQAALFARFPFPQVLKINWAFILRVTTPAFNVRKFGQKLSYINQLKPHEKIMKDIELIRPNILSAPPSMLQIIAREVENGKLRIRPKRVVSYAEVLTPEVKNELEEVFGVIIHQIYQCSEGPIAMSCKYGNLHVNEDLIRVECFDRQGNPTPSEEPCHNMIVTDLHKRSQPIIRFELNDIITLSQDKCKCGSCFRVIRQIMGRSDDIFWAKRSDKNELQYIFPDYIRRAIITSSSDIGDYQAIQNDLEKIHVKIKPVGSNIDKEKITSIIQKKIEEVFISYSCLKPDVSVVFENPELNPYSAKLIRIQRNFKV